MKNFLHRTRFLLFPFSMLYGLAIWTRNQCFNTGLIKSVKFSVPVIVVGNLKAGGTGKTPFTEFIIKILKEKYNIALLSRGYKRNTKGFREVKENDFARNVGDEACQVKNKFPGIIVAVAEKRVDGIKKIVEFYPETELIILDDAFQHRYVEPGFSILLTEFTRPFYKDFLLPAGMLREYRQAYKRADMIVFTKCYDGISLIDKENYIKELKPTSRQLVFFSKIEYRPLQLLWGNNTATPHEINSVLLVTGIANPNPIIHYLREKYNVETIIFPDHHFFTVSDLKKILKKFESIQEKNKIILTTDKDASRFKEMENLTPRIKDNLYILPITFEILFNKENTLKKSLIHYVEENR